VRTALAQLRESGIAEGQSRSEQRRIRTVNAVAGFAFVVTALFAVLFLPAKPESLPVWSYVGLLALYLVGYAMVPVLNRGGSHEGAAALLLGTGLLNIAAVNVTVGFGTGTAVF
jgi:ABC-type phosphate transport system permease subunit